ncbi:BTAD domain-containing putative transcriptional regulator [Amycolatopsis sp. NPDC059021]|uniref:AfsR/SARP family transcriptional regulator n=1 Tax=Amycolatopsis sp. NPDC059021 TaxID=3346704 RepID=UPI003672FB2F
MQVEINVLGPLEVVVQGQAVTPSAPKLCQLLALFVARHNQVTSTNDLIDELWGERPPRSAQATLQTYVHKLRKLLVITEAGRTERLLHTHSHGYLLAAPPEAVDQFRFEQLARRGRVALADGAAERASALFREALALWRGSVLSGLQTGELLSAHVTRLEEIRLNALESRIDADLRHGRQRELVSELKELVLSYPLHEGFHTQLIVSLSRCERRYEASNVYHQLRRRMRKELGLEPSPSLQRLHEAVLSGGGGRGGGGGGGGAGRG